MDQENISFLFGGAAKTYSRDLALFQKLNFPAFSINNQDETYVGIFSDKENKDSYVKIWVTCMPAHFWRFEIKNTEGELFVMTTGSGFLTDYWPSVMLIFESMMNINIVK